MQANHFCIKDVLEADLKKIVGDIVASGRIPLVMLCIDIKKEGYSTVIHPAITREQGIDIIKDAAKAHSIIEEIRNMK